MDVKEQESACLPHQNERLPNQQEWIPELCGLHSSKKDAVQGSCTRKPTKRNEWLQNSPTKSFTHNKLLQEEPQVFLEVSELQRTGINEMGRYPNLPWDQGTFEFHAEVVSDAELEVNTDKKTIHS